MLYPLGGLVEVLILFVLSAQGIQRDVGEVLKVFFKNSLTTIRLLYALHDLVLDSQSILGKARALGS